jgi:hypothetical protein
MGAKSANLSQAEYGAISLSPANKNHEKIRIMHRVGSVRIFERQIQYPAFKIGVADPYLAAATDSVNQNGDIRHSVWQNSAIIAP